MHVGVWQRGDADHVDTLAAPDLHHQARMFLAPSLPLLVGVAYVLASEHGPHLWSVNDKDEVNRFS